MGRTPPASATATQITGRISRLLPDSLTTYDSYYFDTAESGTFFGQGTIKSGIRVIGIVGVKSQFVVYGSSSDDQDVSWDSVTFSRTSESIARNELEPFEYEVRITEDGEASGVETVTLMDLLDGEYASNEMFGGLILAEFIAHRRASNNRTRRERMSHYGSFAMYGSLLSAINSRRITIAGEALEWSHIGIAFGPDAETRISKSKVEIGVPNWVYDGFPADLSLLTSGKETAKHTRQRRYVTLVSRMQSGGESTNDIPTFNPTQGTIRHEIEGYRKYIKTFPNEVVGALSDGNIGRARTLAERNGIDFDAVVTAYSIYKFYIALGALSTSTQAIQLMKENLDSFANHADGGKNQLGEDDFGLLEKASESFVTVTESLSSTAKPTLREVRGLLTYTALQDDVDGRIAADKSLQGDSLQYYWDATDTLLGIAQEQHTRGEWGRSVYALAKMD